MNNRVIELTNKYKNLAVCANEIDKAIEIITNCYKNEGKLLLCGNGGSAADSAHIVGELMKGFLSKRPVDDKKANELKTNNPIIDDEFLANLQCGLPAIDLCESVALLTAFCNDVNPDYIYAQQLFGLGKKGDVLICLSTSGNAKNVNLAATLAKGLGITVIGMTGEKTGLLEKSSDICIKVPETETYKIQELHLPVYHAICDAVEKNFFN